jgi:hypothetical protein
LISSKIGFKEIIVNIFDKKNYCFALLCFALLKTLKRLKFCVSTLPCQTYLYKFGFNKWNFCQVFKNNKNTDDTQVEMLG